MLSLRCACYFIVSQCVKALRILSTPCPRKKSPWLCQCQSFISNWLSVSRVSVPREKKSPWLRQYQSYFSNWYINGKLFMSTTAWKPKNWIFLSKKFEIEFWLVPKSWNQFNFVNISPTLVIDTSMESFSHVLQHGNPKILIFFSKKFLIEFWLVFWHVPEELKSP